MIHHHPNAAKMKRDTAAAGIGSVWEKLDGEWQRLWNRLPHLELDCLCTVRGSHPESFPEPFAWHKVRTRPSSMTVSPSCSTRTLRTSAIRLSEQKSPATCDVVKPAWIMIYHRRKLKNCRSVMLLPSCEALVLYTTRLVISSLS